jgi:hypothetical protein
MTTQHHCPTCGREFKDILDYPRVRILDVERLPIPEAVDTFSAAAVEKRMARRRAEPSAEHPFAGAREDGINMTPVIAKACERSEVQEYFAHLAAIRGREIESRELLPPFPADGIFKRAYPVADTGIYLMLSDAEESTEAGRVAEVEVLCEGLNMGSAGGPTLQLLGAVARIRYEGLLSK